MDMLMRIIDDEPSRTAPLPRNALLASERAPGDERRWTVKHTAGKFELRAFPDINAQRYSAYQDVAG